MAPRQAFRSRCRAIAPGYNRKAFPWYTAPAQQPKQEQLADVGP